MPHVKMFLVCKFVSMQVDKQSKLEVQQQFSYIEVDLQPNYYVNVNVFDVFNTFTSSNIDEVYLAVHKGGSVESRKAQFQKKDNVVYCIFGSEFNNSLSESFYLALHDGTFSLAYIQLSVGEQLFVVTDVNKILNSNAQQYSYYSSQYDNNAIQVKINATSSLCDVYECLLYINQNGKEYHLDQSFFKVNHSFQLNSTNLRFNNNQAGQTHFQQIINNFKQYGLMMYFKNADGEVIHFLHNNTGFDLIQNHEWVPQMDYYNGSAIFNYVDVKQSEQHRVVFDVFDVFYTIQAMETTTVTLQYEIQNITYIKKTVLPPLANKEYDRRYRFIWNFSQTEIDSFQNGDASNLSMLFHHENDYIFIGEFITDFHFVTKPQVHFSQSFSESEVNISVASPIDNPCGQGVKLRMVANSGNVTAVYNKFINKVTHIFQFNETSSNISNQIKRFVDNSRLYGIFVKFTSEDGKCVTAPVQVGNVYDDIVDSGWHDDNPVEPSKQIFSFSKKQFLLNNTPFQIKSGELHPSRIPHQYWRNRLQMAKAMGLNTVSIYFFWNQHQQNNSGTIDFITPQNNIGKFIQIAYSEGLFVLVRPGPYVCGEWDFGGILPELLLNANVSIRTIKDENYKVAVSMYIKALANHLRNQMVYNGGNILMIQIENEYGSWPVNRQEKEYVNWLVEQWKLNNISGPFYTADASQLLTDTVHPADAAIGLNGAPTEEDLEVASKLDSEVPVFVSELQTGAPRYWGENTWEEKDVSTYLQDYMNKNISFNLYMIHGGSNFGFHAGSLADGEKLKPALTSYDFGAPIDESGQPTQLYAKYQQILGGKSLKRISVQEAGVTVDPIVLERVGHLFSQPGKTETVNIPERLEKYGQNQGYAKYSANVTKGQLKIGRVNDYAQIFLNHVLIATFDRTKGGPYVVEIPQDGKLDILLEAFGHIDIGIAMEQDTKGIFDVTLGGQPLLNWEQVFYPIGKQFTKNLVKDSLVNSYTDGSIFVGSFNVTKLGYIYLDLKNYKKGIVMINGHLLGRYWNDKGPQKRLFCPSEWLVEQNNQIIVLDSTQTVPIPITIDS